MNVPFVETQLQHLINTCEDSDTITRDKYILSTAMLVVPKMLHDSGLPSPPFPSSPVHVPSPRTEAPQTPDAA